MIKSNRLESVSANDIESTPSNSNHVTRLYFIAAAFLVASFSAFSIDGAVTRFFVNGDVPGDLRKGLHLAEVFSHGIGVAMICLTIFCLVSDKRRGLLRVVVSAYGAGLLTNLIKTLVVRLRPSYFRGPDGIKPPESISDTFLGWGPSIYADVQEFGSLDVLRSFPSGHTTTAVGFAIALAWLFPKGRWLFVLFAVLAGLQRIEAGAHFLSDTLAGAAVGTFFAAACHDSRWLGKPFDRFESRTRSQITNESSALT